MMGGGGKLGETDTWERGPDKGVKEIKVHGTYKLINAANDL